MKCGLERLECLKYLDVVTSEVHLVGQVSSHDQDLTTEVTVVPKDICFEQVFFIQDVLINDVE